MLTKVDLKQIRGVVREEIEAEGRNIRDEVGNDLFQTKARITSEINELSNRVKNVEIRVNSVDTKVTEGFKKVAVSLKNIRKDVKYTRGFLDRRDIQNEERIAKVEAKLQIEPAI